MVKFLHLKKSYTSTGTIFIVSENITVGAKLDHYFETEDEAEKYCDSLRPQIEIKKETIFRAKL